MKPNKSFIFSLVLLTIVAALYRIIPGRPLGFAPQIAMAVFAGAVVKNKKWAFALPLISMVVSDILYQVLYISGVSSIQGFYDGQLVNYLLFLLLVLIGFAVKKINLINVLLASVTAPTVYFILSNFMVWMGSGGWARPKTFSGLMWCYSDALPFYQGSIEATLIFSAIFFGTYLLINKKQNAIATI
ncbi:MAG TPA: DUF6580 family putative transport protein [Puia sp.]|nr:DUF6580 family putative transport protein [Puia sp.]